MTVTFGDALRELPERTRARLEGPIAAVGLGEEDPVAFAGHVLRLGERGLLVLTERDLVFAAETGRVDRTPLERLALAIPRDTMLTIAPGEGGRRQDEFRPLKPASFAGVDWPAGIRAVHPDAGPRSDARSGARVAAFALLVVLLVAAVAAAALLLA
jgi:CBS domain-containing protein